MCWPFASYDKTRIGTLLGLWLFAWDDEVDNLHGAVWGDWTAAQEYREKTIAYVRYTVGLDSHCPEVTNRIILGFKVIGDAIKDEYDTRQRLMFFKEMQFFINMSEQEQKSRLSGRIPSLKEFWHSRLGSSAVTVCLAMNEFAWDGMKLPEGFGEDADVRSIWHHTNTIISASNDLYSFKKEIVSTR